jgi:hypothetical protein
MKTFTKLFAATALLASASTATLAQGNSGAAIDAAGTVFVDAGSTSVDAGASGNANANANSNAGGNGNGGNNSNAGGSANSNAGGHGNANANSNAGGNGNGAANAAAHSNAGGNASANADGQLNYGQIISDLLSSATTIDNIEALDGTSFEFEVVTLAELRGNAGENAAALEQAVSAETVTKQLDALEAKLAEASRTLADVLGTYTTDQVVAVATSAEGEVILVIDESK